ncbi:MAG TPA: Mor transcription activator family protein [Lachnospiraceae bacterium]|nr:Mor transcription activator family protein [Lachnospiraceae bacterium]
MIKIQDNDIKISNLAEVYKDFAELIGYENVIVLYHYMGGQQVSFPKKLYSKEYIDNEICRLYNGNNIKQLAKKFNYTDCHIYRILKRYKYEI